MCRTSAHYYEGCVIMKNKKINGIQIIIILALIFSNVFAENNPLKGKDIVKLGTLQTISGEIFEEYSEWYLITKKDTIDLHFGPREFLASKNVILKEKNIITFTGFLYENHLAVVKFIFDKKLVELRTKDGDPLWRNTKFSRNNNRKRK